MKQPLRHSTKWWHVLWVCLIGMLLGACKPSVPSRYLQPDELEDILFDYHLAESITQQQFANDSTALLSFKTNILAKHGVSSADFDSTLVYYTRHTRLLHDVYESLADRLSDKAMAQGATVGELNKYGSITSSSDTANVWNGDRVFVLSPYPSFNSYSFEVKADTAFHKGDKILLDFDTQFIYQDGMRDAIAVMAVRFTNDSVATQTVRPSSSSHYHMQVSDDSLKVKSIRGYFMLNKKITESSTTLRMMVVSNITLIRMHNTPKPAPTTETNGSDKASTDTTTASKTGAIGPRNLSNEAPQPMPKPRQGIEPMKKMDADDRAARSR